MTDKEQKKYKKICKNCRFRWLDKGRHWCSKIDEAPTPRSIVKVISGCTIDAFELDHEYVREGGYV
jgi:hypothetical protein